MVFVDGNRGPRLPLSIYLATVNMKHPFQNWVVLFRWCIGTGRHLVHTGVDLDAFQYTVVEKKKYFVSVGTLRVFALPCLCFC